MSKQKIAASLIASLSITVGLCLVANGQALCKYWFSRIDTSVDSPEMHEKINEKDPEIIMKGIDCLLKMEGNKREARFSGATRNDTSQISGPATVEVAALFYISYLYYQNWESFSGGIALRGTDGKISSIETTRKAYKYYREWFKEAKRIGIQKARELEMAPLKGKDVSWY